jgi:hypothetical protein
VSRVTVHIDRLVLRGPVAQPDRIAEGLQRELARLLGEPGVARSVAATGDVPHLRAGPVHAGQPTAPLQLGVLAARAIVRCMGGPGPGAAPAKPRAGVPTMGAPHR